MADNLFRVQRGVSLTPQSTIPANPVNGDFYYDSNAGTFIMYNNSAWINVASQADVASASTLNSTQFTSAIVQNSLVRVTGTNASSFYGMTASAAGKEVVVYNDTNQNITIFNQNAGEPTAANRFTTPGGTTLTVPLGSAVTLVYDATGQTWIIAYIASASLTNPMTSVGDLIVGGVSGTPTRLGIGTTGTVLKSNGTTETWATLTTQVQYFNVSGSFTVPSGVTQLTITGCGGGGGGGGGGAATGSPSGGGGGGGAGAIPVTTLVTVVPGDVLTVLVGGSGLGGTGGTSANGSAGTAGSSSQVAGGTYTIDLYFPGAAGGSGGINSGAGGAGGSTYVIGGASSIVAQGPTNGGAGASGVSRGAVSLSGGAGYYSPYSLNFGSGGTGGSSGGAGGAAGGGGGGGGSGFTSLNSSGGNGGASGFSGSPSIREHSGIGATGYGCGGGGGAGGSVITGSYNSPGGNGAAGSPGLVVITWVA